MNGEIIKLKLHELIDQLEDHQSLQHLYARALEFNDPFVEQDSFTEDLWAEIDEGLAQIRNDEPCTHQFAIEKFMEWQRKK